MSPSGLGTTKPRKKSHRMTDKLYQRLLTSCHPSEPFASPGGEPRRMTGRRSLDPSEIGRQSKSRFSDGCSIRVAFERLEIPPARANSSPSVDALAGTNRFKPTARCSVWSGLAVRNSHQTHQRLPPPVESLTTRVSGTSRRNVLGAIAQAKNDRNFPQRRQPN